MRMFKVQIPASGGATKIEGRVGMRYASVQNQRGEVTIWFLADVDAPRETRHLRCFVTGYEETPGFDAYIGTAQLDGGDYVVHVFEVFR